MGFPSSQAQRKRVNAGSKATYGRFLIERVPENDDTLQALRRDTEDGTARFDCSERGFKIARPGFSRTEGAGSARDHSPYKRPFLHAENDRHAEDLSSVATLSNDISKATSILDAKYNAGFSTRDRKPDTGDQASGVPRSEEMSRNEPKEACGASSHSKKHTDAVPSYRPTLKLAQYDGEEEEDDGDGDGVDESLSDDAEAAGILDYSSQNKLMGSMSPKNVSEDKEEEVVMFIRAARETHTGHLTLVVRPNVYVGEEYKEPAALPAAASGAAEFHYAPDTRRITARGAGLDPLPESLLMLQEALESGAVLAQFDQLYRRKVNLTNQAAKLPANVGKNRYRDISPYDQTRVVLRSVGGSGDYINANYVNMEVPGAGIVNRYIAAQGPLPNTVTDFWQMVWDEGVSLVAMLTALVERGRVKCHKYWPQLYETSDLGALQLTCVRERETRSFAFREFTLVHGETGEERLVRQIQYVAWPDHGVPDDPADFLDFVIRVRQDRVGMVEPILVHCSAGIGRTGVLILMETAMCLIEAGQPVYPLDVVRQMRDQRAMLIQTGGQYRFVCDAILRVYQDKIVKPLDDFTTTAGGATGHDGGSEQHQLRDSVRRGGGGDAGPMMVRDGHGRHSGAARSGDGMGHRREASLGRGDSLGGRDGGTRRDSMGREGGGGGAGGMRGSHTMPNPSSTGTTRHSVLGMY